MPTARAIVTLLCLALLAAMLGTALHLQSAADEARADAKSASQQAAGLAAALKQSRQETTLARKSVQVVTKYVDRVQVIQAAAKTITKEIPVYVTPSADASCVVTAGFVRIHDAAAAGTAADPATGNPDAPAAGIALSDVAGVTADNYAQYHTVAAQLTALQDYVATSCQATPASP